MKHIGRLPSAVHGEIFAFFVTAPTCILAARPEAPDGLDDARFMTVFFFLNDVADGGETVLFGTDLNGTFPEDRAFAGEPWQKKALRHLKVAPIRCWMTKFWLFFIPKFVVF